MAKEKETIAFSAEEMDIIFLALAMLEKDAGTILSQADKLGAKKAASGANEYKNKVEELKNRFLHQ